MVHIGENPVEPFEIHVEQIKLAVGLWVFERYLVILKSAM